MDDCIFCKIAKGEIPSHTLYEDAEFRVILDITPAAEGHALILPKAHADDIHHLEEALAARLFPLAKRVAAAQIRNLGVDGVNILQNNGAAAGQTVRHVHVHVIPRYEVDGVNIGWRPLQMAAEALAETARKIGKV